MNGLIHNEMVQAYLDSVCERVRCREVHTEIREELLSHIADRMEALMESGMAESDAAAEALTQMGDPVVVGRQLHQLHRPRLDWWLLGAMTALVLVGLWAMYAVDVSGSLVAQHVGLLPHQLVWSGIGLGAGVLAALFDYRRLRRLSWPLFGIALLITTIVVIFSESSSGRPLAVDLTPLLYLPPLAGLFADWNWNARHRPWKALVLLVVPGLVYLQVHNFFALVEYLVLAGVLLMTSKPKWPQIMLLAGAASVPAAMAAYAVLTTPHLHERLLIWTHYIDEPLGAGYQITQSLSAFRQAGFWGHGALAKLSNLPETHHDFVFPYLVYTLGWIAGGAVCLLVLLFAVRLIRASRGVKDPYGGFLIRGVATLLILQLVWNLLMTVGIAPIMSVNLPFISGGAQQAAHMALVGLTVSVFRRKTTIAKNVREG